MKTLNTTQNGFTLLELVIAILVVGVLAAIAYPSYQEYAMETRRTEGTAALMRMMDLQERRYTNNFPPAYTTTLTDLGYQNALTFTTTNGHYDIVADAGCVGAGAAAGLGTCVTLTATPRGIQDPDGILILDSLGFRSRDGVEGAWDD